MKNKIIWTTIVVFFVGLLAGLAAADEATVTKPAPVTPVPLEPEEPTIILPIVPVLVEPEDELPVPEPPRPKPPGTVRVSELAADTWYVVESSIPLIFLHSPTGCVAVSHEEGPVKIRGKFADGTGGIETRTYKLPHVYSVNAVAAGKIELLIIPEGVKAEKDILRQQLTVMGQAPNPPPKPDPKPDPHPEPGPTPTPESDHLLVEIVEDPLNRKPDTAIVLSALAEWNALKDKGHDWRIYSPRTKEPFGIEAMKAANGVPLPAMIVRDKQTRKILRTLPLPVTIADVKRVLSELTGGVL